MKTSLALFLAATLVVSADSEIFHPDPERGIVRVARSEDTNGKVTTTYLNVSQIVRLTVKTEGKSADARATLVIVSSEVDPSKPTDSKHLTYEIHFPNQQLAEEAIQKIFAKNRAS